MRQVEYLEFDRNLKANELSSLIGNFKDLSTLNLEFNQISSLPTTLLFCQKLKTLKLMNCRFTELPGFLQHLPNLESITRYHNPFDENNLNMYHAKLNVYIIIKNKVKINRNRKMKTKRKNSQHKVNSIHYH